MMCSVCGCGAPTIEGEPGREDGRPRHQHHHHHHHEEHAGGQHAPESCLDHADPAMQVSDGGAHDHPADLNNARTVRVEQEILAKNNAFARANRERLTRAGIFALNFVSSPGSGKTTLLCRTILALKDRLPIAVIEGDQQTSNDAERIRATGVPAVQVNTGKGCHLDAHMVGHALDDLPHQPGGLLFIENVGNLICPSGFDLGEAHKVVVLSVTEGEDKPLKYPDMFAAADLMLLNKSDLLPHVDFNVAACMAAALRVNPHLQMLTVSARSGEGLAAFYAWIEARAAVMREAQSAVP